MRCTDASVRRARTGDRRRDRALALLVASIPFIANGRVGILGVGLVNDDMASHLLIADWLERRGSAPMPVLIHQGYPVGPHALVAGLSEGLGAGLIEVFAGLTLAIPALTALVAFEALRGLRPGPAGDRRGARRAALSGGRLPRAGGVQGADRGAVPALLRAPAARRRRPSRAPSRWA